MKLIHDMLRETAERFGKWIAVDSLDRQITFLQFLERTEYVAAGLTHLGVQKGDRIAILAHNCQDYLVYHYAVAMIGAILVPLNIRHADREMLWVLDNAGCSILVVDEPMQSHLEELRSKCAFLRFTVGIGTVEGATYSTDELVNSKNRVHGFPPLSLKDPVLLIFTSGTTGRPKGALQTHEGIAMIDELTAEEWGATEKDVYLAFLPFFHQAGLLRARAVLIKGGKNVIAGKINLEQFVSCMREKKVSIAVLPPSYDQKLLEITEKERMEFPSLRLIIGLGGGGPKQAGRIRWFCEKFGCDYQGVYGQTETTGPVTVVSGKDFLKNPFTCGKPRKGMELEIWDENGDPVPREVTGEIVVRGKNTIPGYWHNEEANRLLYTGDWLHTGDLGRLDEEGFLYFVDRKKELVKTGGENVYPKEVEDVLKEHPDISDVTIFGLPDPNRWGEVVTAAIVSKSGEKISVEEISTFCRNKIAGYKIPKIIEMVEEIPRNITGKAMKLELREKFSNRE